MGDLESSYAPCHENIIFAIKDCFCFPNGRPLSIVRSMRVAPEKLLHPNEKPIDLLKQLIGHITKPNDIVLDPFLGSGSCAIAALQLGRRFIGIELDPIHFNKAIERIKNAQLPLL